jgi:hypothetical protein
MPPAYHHTKRSRPILPRPPTSANRGVLSYRPHHNKAGDPSCAHSAASSWSSS